MITMQEALKRIKEASKHLGKDTSEFIKNSLDEPSFTVINYPLIRKSMHVEFDTTGRLIFHTINNAELIALKGYKKENKLTDSEMIILYPDHCDNTFNRKSDEN